MNKYRIVCRAIFSESYLRNFKPKKHYMQRTFYYKAHSPEHALAKLEDYRGIANGHGSTNTWEWKIISVKDVILDWAA